MRVPVMKVGIVWVDVHGFFVSVLMRVLPLLQTLRTVHVLMVLIVNMGVLMFKRSMPVGVFVALSQMQYHANTHEYGRNQKRNRQVFIEKYVRNRYTGKWSHGEVRARSCRAKVSQGKHEQSQTYAVTEATHYRGARNRVGLRRGCANQPSDCYVDGSCHQALQGCNLHGIAPGDLAGKVIVSGPCQAGTCDGYRPPWRAAFWPSSPAQQRATSNNGSHPGQNACVEVLFEHEPRQQRCKDPFKIQEQRGR